MTDKTSHTAASVRDAVFALLRHHGMTTIFGNPGSTELPMFSDLPPDFRYVTGLQESVVVAMADGHALARKGPAFVNLHSAAGVGHAMGSIYSAFRNRAPVVITAGQQSRSLLAHDPFLFAENPTALPQPYVKWAIEPARAEDVPAAIARAIHMAMLPPMGPVFVSIPLDDWSVPCTPPPLRQVTAAQQAVDADIATIAAECDAATDPVIVVGAAADAAGTWDELIALAEALQAPVWAAPLASRCAFPEDHPLFAGFIHANENDVMAVLGEHDLCLAIGTPVFTYHYDRPAPARSACRLLQLVEDPAQAAGALMGQAFVAGLAPTLAQLAPRVARRPQRAAPLRRITPPAQPARRITQDFAMATLSRLRPKDWIVAEESPTARGPLHDQFPITRPGGFFATASGGLGYAMPAAVGIALAQDLPVLAIIGDGSAMYSVQALWSAAEQDADVLFVIFNNGGYRALEGFAGNLPVAGCTIGHLSLAGLAQAQGCPAQSVSDPAALEGVLAQAIAAKGPRLVEIMLV